MRLIATKEFTYANVPLKVGDPFDASDEDARLLKGWDKARDEVEAHARSAGYHTTAMKSDAPEQPERYEQVAQMLDADEYPARKRRGRPPKDSGFYNRTDMRPEE